MQPGCTVLYKRRFQRLFLLCLAYPYLGGVLYGGREKRKTGRHTLHMEEREKVQIGGVLEVLSFDEEGVMMETACGLLILKGSGMHIGKLDLDSGDVTVDGVIDSITYSDGSFAEKHSILGRLFR